MANPVQNTPPVGVLPVLDRITANIVATLLTIKKANGYSFDAAATLPNPGLGDSLIDGRVIVVLGDAKLEDSRPMQMTQWLQEYYILAEVVQSETDYVISIDRRRMFTLADMQFALTYDADLGNRVNASRVDLATGRILAEDTLLANPIIPPLAENANSGQIVAVVNVRYRTAYNNPYRSVYDA